MRRPQATGIYYNLLEEDPWMNRKNREFMLSRAIHIMSCLVNPTVSQDRLNP